MISKGYTLVTGGAGFIGSHLVERLLGEGESVVVLDDLSTGSLENLRVIVDSPRLRVVQAKISQCAALPELVAGAKCIYHLAAAVGVDLVVNSPVRVLQTNLHETEVLLELASARGVPLLFTSTSEVYGKSQKEAFSEEDDLLIGPPHFGRWSYACSKLMDEFLIQAYMKEKAGCAVPSAPSGLGTATQSGALRTARPTANQSGRGLPHSKADWPAVIARLFNTVGPGQTGRYGMVLPRFIAAAKAGQPLRVFGDGRQTRCFCYVADTVEALIRLQNCPAARGETINVGSTEEISILDLARLVIEVLGSRSPIEFVPYHEAYAPGFEDMLRRKPVVDKLERVAGFRPRTGLREIIERTGGSETLNVMREEHEDIHVKDNRDLHPEGRDF